MSVTPVFAASSLDSWLDAAAQQPMVTIFVLTLILLAIGQLLRPTILNWLGLQLQDSTPAPTPLPTATKEPEPSKEEPVAEEPVVEEPTVEEPTVEEPAEEPTVEEPAEEPSEEPVSEEKKPPAEETPVAEEIKDDKEPTEEEKKDDKPQVELGDGEHPTVIRAPKRTKERKSRRRKKNKNQESDENREQRRQRTEELIAKRKQTVDDLELEDNSGHEPRTLREGLDKTRKGWVSRLNQFFLGQKELNDEMYEELEEILFTADIGTRTTQRLLQTIEEKLEGKELADFDVVKQVLKDEIYKILKLENATMDIDAHDPFVVMVVGVNGAGKTTTIGKLAARYRKLGKSVLIGAADTFRAAAVDQLEIWAERVGADLIRGGDKTDPSSVVFDAVEAAKARKIDIVFADTAGRLQTQTNLMEELKKIKRVIGKAQQGAPHEVLLVLDANTGQNAISQAREFNAALDVTGITLTKLDGTAKGGVVIGISEDLKIPIRFIGVGEHIDELRTFDPNEFVEALF